MQAPKRAIRAGSTIEEDATPVAPDLSGWTPHPSERRDFWNRIRAFPPEVVGWRKRLLRELAENPGRFTLAAGLPAEQLQERLDSGISHLREVARILAVLYGSPDLGNKPDPTDELVYIILLAGRHAGGRIPAGLRCAEGAVPDLGRAARRPAGRGREAGLLGRPARARRPRSLYGALGKLRETFGSCTLEPARDWSDEKLEAFLCELPEIQRKSAYCVMMYSFGRKVFPADTHVGRVLSRIGPYRELGLSLDGLDHKKLQRELAELMPPNLRYSLHVNLVEHGRAVCRSPRPLCEQVRAAQPVPVLPVGRIGPGHGEPKPLPSSTCSPGRAAPARASPGPGSRRWRRSRWTRWPPGPTASITPRCPMTG